MSTTHHLSHCQYYLFTFIFEITGFSEVKEIFETVYKFRKFHKSINFYSDHWTVFEPKYEINNCWSQFWIFLLLKLHCIWNGQRIIDGKLYIIFQIAECYADDICAFSESKEQSCKKPTSSTWNIFRSQREISCCPVLSISVWNFLNESMGYVNYFVWIHDSEYSGVEKFLDWYEL